MFSEVLLKFRVMDYDYTTPFLLETIDGIVYEPVVYHERFKRGGFVQFTMLNGSELEIASINSIVKDMFENIQKPTIYNEYSKVFLFHNLYFRVLNNEDGLVNSISITATSFKYDLVETLVFKLRDLINKDSKVFNEIVDIEINFTPFKEK